MIETATPASIPLTPLAALLKSAATSHELSAYRGTLTPWQLDAPARETEALLFGAASHDLGWLRRVAVRGEDRFRWLNGMLTNAVSGLGANSGDWNLALDAQGHVQGDMYAWREDPGWSSRKPAFVTEGHDSSPRRQEAAAGEIGLDVEMAADQYEKLLAHLERFIIMDDVELVPLDGESALGLTGPLAAEVLGRLGLPVLAEPLTAAHVEWNSVDLRIVRSYGALVPHYEIWAPLPRLAKVWKALRIAGATPVGTGAVAALRVAEGIPAYGIDMVEQDLPQETSQMRAISFNKGCYLGQEIVERIRSRSSVHRHLRPLELFGPVPANGTELSMPDNSEKEAVTGKGEPATAAGQITSAAELQLPASHRVFALAMIRDEAEQRSKTFMYTDGTATGMAHILTAMPSFETGTAS